MKSLPKSLLNQDNYNNFPKEQQLLLRLKFEILLKKLCAHKNIVYLIKHYYLHHYTFSTIYKLLLSTDYKLIFRCFAFSF